MADDPNNRGEPDRSRVSASEEHELRYFADQAGITIEQTRDLIAKHGNDRATLMEAAKGLGGPKA